MHTIKLLKNKKKSQLKLMSELVLDFKQRFCGQESSETAQNRFTSKPLCPATDRTSV